MGKRIWFRRWWVFFDDRPDGAGGGDERLRIDLRFPNPLEMGDGLLGQGPGDKIGYQLNGSGAGFSR